VCETPTDALELKFVSPAYVAMIVFAPAVVEVKEQLPAETVPTQLADPSLTVTLPDGVPLPGALAATVNATVYACPAFDGAVKFEVIVVAVLALATVIGLEVALLAFQELLALL
jgi:hypothetical protein